ncbi:MAG: amino acid-binding protein [Bacteroidales bacterium]|nr:amino acid-binding protein [Bacteroidales bacterium]MBO7055869.1 amino acid-binding protein [Bacteroidales bacterium]
MVVKQLSVFLENKANSLNKMLQVLTDNGINMSAFCVADSVDYGIVRFCVGRPELAYQILKDNNYTVRLTDVVCIEVPHESGGLHKAIRLISERGINIDYMYAFADGGSAKVVIRCDSNEALIDILQENNIQMVKI